jgi:hypothetical protein
MGSNLGWYTVYHEYFRYFPQCFTVWKVYRYTNKCFYYSILATDPEARVRFPALPEKKVVGLERDPLSPVSTTEKLLDRKVAAPV